MCAPKIPAPPPPPDYAAATRAGYESDIATLPQRRLIEAQARMGEGQFEGLGDADLAKALLQQQLEAAPEVAARYLDLQRQYGVPFAEEARRQLEATDPEGFMLRQQFGERLLNNAGAMEDLALGLNVPNYERFQGSGPSLERISDITLADSGRTAAGRAMLEGQIFDDLARAGTLDPALRTATEQAVRARGAARGNLLGDSSALEESLAVQLAQRQADQQRRGSALELLSSGQSTSDTANRLAQQNLQNRFSTVGQRNQAGQQEFQNVMEAINQRNQASQNQFAAQAQAVGQRQGARQQDLANIQSFLGLQPIVSQGGQLAGLQQGAAPFMTGQYQGTNLNPNAGAQGAAFAQNIFGTQTNQWRTQAANAAQGGILGTLGRIAKVGSDLGSAYSDFNCHVAREVYGENNPDWVKFYFWKEDKAPWWFRLAYNKWSREIAAAIRPFPKLKARIRAWMDSKINTESKTYG